MPKINIVKVEVYADELGNTVRQCTPAGKYENTRGQEGVTGQDEGTVFTGTAMVMVQGPGQPPRQQPMTFQMPETVKTMQQAFDEFETHADAYLEEVQRKQREAAKQVVPASAMPQMLGPNGQPIKMG